MTDYNEYFRYLTKRSKRGLYYRRYWLYPRLNRWLRGRVLDIGCGIGDFLRFRPGTIGVDVNPGTVAFCKEQGLPAQTMEPDQLPFSEREFEGVMLDNVLEHIESPRPLLNEIARVVVPGGRLIVGVPGRRGYASDADHKVFYDRHHLEAVVEASDFSLIRIIHMPIRMEWLDARVRQYCLYGVFERN